TAAIMIIAQISDCHIAWPRRAEHPEVDPEKLLYRAIETIRAMPATPDLVLATGDLADGGRAQEYEIFAQITSKLNIPLLPVVGNQDDREALAAAFNLRSSLDTQPGFIQYAVDGFPVRILVVDSITPGSGEPSLCGARLAWIEAELSRDRGPTLIAMHHPPFP